MPSQNSIQQQYDTNHYYHVYNRGALEQLVFRNSADKWHFLNLLKRHIDPEDDSVDVYKRPYKKFALDLVAYISFGSKTGLDYFV
jgi:hypothetical protein